jgi:class 3 adenylate cyclase
VRRLWHLPFRRLSVKITGLSVLLIGLTIAYFANSTYKRESWLMQARFGKALQRVVQVAALSVKPGDAAAVTRAYLERVAKAGGLAKEGISLFTLRIDDPEAYLAAGDADRPDLPVGVVVGGAKLGPQFEEGPAVHRALARAVKRGKSSYSATYGEGNDRVAAFAAIRQGDAVVALLGAEHDFAHRRQARDALLRRVMLTSGVALFLGALMSWLLALGISRALERIRAGARAIAAEDFTHRVEVRREDELGMVARSFNDMADSLAERLHMMKFLPSYTHEAVARMSREGHSDEVEVREGSVVFTDIRGYTSLSAGIPAEQVVAMLNVYLRLQAEAVHRHDGVIDKFIGDAVMAIFLGEGHAQRALDCSGDILREVAAMNHKEAFDVPVQVGIGIASGRLALAEIGSEERKERTLIGSVVNLAARLCSHAGAEEVVVSDAVRALVGSLPADARREDVELKGFAEPQAVHVLGGPVS